LASIIIAVVAIGCVPTKFDAEFVPTRYEGRRAYRVADDWSEVVVVPGLRRLMHFGPAGGPNMLYVNPVALAAPPKGPAAWANYGGDKVWFWPQQPVWTWPPPGDAAADPGHVVASKIGPILRTRSEPVSRYDVTIKRTFALRYGKLGIESALRPTDRAATKLDGVAVWQITQVPRPDRILARLTPGAEPRPVPQATDAPDERRLPVVATHAGGRVIEVSTGPGETDDGYKSHFDADRLATLHGDRLFVLTHVGPAGPYRPGERAQVFASPRPSAPSMGGAPPYVELEFTGPRAAAGAAPPALHTTIEVHEGVTSVERAAAIVAGE